MRQQKLEQFSDIGRWLKGGLLSSKQFVNDRVNHIIQIEIHLKDIPL